MAYALAKLPLETLIGPVARATEVLARLDERLARSPVRDGFVERHNFAEATAALWLEGELVHSAASGTCPRPVAWQTGIGRIRPTIRSSPGRRVWRGTHKVHPRTDRRRRRAPAPPVHPGPCGSRPAASPHRPWLPSGSCRTHRSDHLDQKRRSDVSPHADRCIADDDVQAAGASPVITRHLHSCEALPGAVVRRYRDRTRAHRLAAPGKQLLRPHAIRAATAEILAPGANACSRIRAFASAGQRRRVNGGPTSRRFATASMTVNVPSPDLGSDCKPTSREESSQECRSP